MALLTIFSLSVSAFAMDVAERDQEDKCLELTFEEVVLRKMAYDNISCAEAKEELLQEEARILEDFGLRYAGTQAVGTQSELILSIITTRRHLFIRIMQAFPVQLTQLLLRFRIMERLDILIELMCFQHGVQQACIAMSGFSRVCLQIFLQIKKVLDWRLRDILV